MANVKEHSLPKQYSTDTAAQQHESSYDLAKLLRSGNRELARQLNIKRAKRSR